MIEDQYEGPRADLTIHRVDPRDERWFTRTLFRDQFRYRVMLKDSNGHWMKTEEAKRSFLKFLAESGGEEFEDWLQTSYAGEDGHPGHSIYCRSISFLLYARMLDNIEIENHVHSIQERNDVEYPDDVKPVVLSGEDGTGPIMDLSENAPTLQSATNAERAQKTSLPLTVLQAGPGHTHARLWDRTAHGNAGRGHAERPRRALLAQRRMLLRRCGRRARFHLRRVFGAPIAIKLVM